jgi:hypothetical protein
MQRLKIEKKPSPVLVETESALIPRRSRFDGFSACTCKLFNRRWSAFAKKHYGSPLLQLIQ